MSFNTPCLPPTTTTLKAVSHHQSGQATPFPVPGWNASVSRDAAYLSHSEAVGAGLARTRKSTCYTAN